MNQTRKLVTYCLATLCAILSTSVSHAAEPAETGPQLVGLYFYANWCGYCKTLDPHLTEAKAELAALPFALVTLDMSNKATQSQARQRAAAHGLEALFDETGVKTGFVLLVDPQTQEVVGRLKHSDSPERMVAKVGKAIEKNGL